MEGLDELIVARIAAGDDYALGDLLDRYGGLLVAMARRVCGRSSMAEDVLQEVVSEFWRRPERFDPRRGSLRAYLGVQARRRAVDAVRSEGRRKAGAERPDLLAGGGPGFGDGRDELALSETVNAVLKRLAFEQKEVVELAYWRGCTHKEIAEVLGIPEGTVKSRLRLAQSKLADWLSPVGAEPR